MLSLLTGSEERVGFIVDDEIVEVKNIHPDPENGFQVSATDLKEYAERASATWHTHPGHTSNLSVEDYHTFLNWPGLRHFIIGTDGVSEYYVIDDEVYSVA